jgi:hypothetical protein
MTRLIVLAGCSLLLLTACASRDAALVSRQDARPTAIVADGERQLTRALVRRNRAVINSYLAQDFTCTVTGAHTFSLNATAARFTACAGMGHDMLAKATMPDPILALENRAPRVAEITDMQVKEEGEAIVVVLTQVYHHWMPYDGAFERRSRLTDTWVHRGGEWRIVKRISEPLPSNVS